MNQENRRSPEQKHDSNSVYEPRRLEDTEPKFRRTTTISQQNSLSGSGQNSLT